MNIPAGALCAFLLLAAATPVHAEREAGAGEGIAPQSLGAALNEFAKRSRLQIIYVTDLAAGLESPGAPPNLSNSATLDRLLAGTSLEYEFVNDRTVTIRPVAESSVDDAVNSGQYDPPAGRLAAQATDELGATDVDAAAVEPGERAIEEIFVTGSRIGRSGFETPTPVTVIDAEAIANSGFNTLSDILLRTPSVGVGLGSSNAWFNPDAGAAFINLRGLGTDRTLTLVNGRRRVAGTRGSSAVDIATIPASMVERVEIVTGGASAVYGADAVTGVVNVSLKDDFDGLEVSARTGVSHRGGGETYSLSMHGGTGFSEGRGSINFGLSYDREQELMWYERDFASRPKDITSNPDNTGPDDGIPDFITVHDVRQPDFGPAAAFFIDGTRYVVDPELRPTVNDETYGGAFTIASGGDGFSDADFAQLRIENDVWSALTNFKYRLTDGIGLFVESNFSRTHARDRKQPVFDVARILYRDNPFIPDELGTLMDANGLTELSISKVYYDLPIRVQDIERVAFTNVAGFEGELDNGWAWETFYQYGRMIIDDRGLNGRVNDRFTEAADVIEDPETGEPVCRSPEARANGCLPIDVLRRDEESPEAIAYFDHASVSDIRNTQHVGGAQLTGEAFELPAGPLEFAAGVEYRKDELSARDDSASVLGLTFDQGAFPVDADIDVVEGFAEMRAPLLQGAPLAEELTVEGAVRRSDYSTIGGTTAWKLGGEWAPVQDLRFRATRSRSVRAPSINELFDPGTTFFPQLDDPCDVSRIDLHPNREANCRALGIPEGWTDPAAAVSNNVVTGGNPDLDPETSNSWTVGAVIRPRGIEGLSISLDYWNIDIDDAINSVSVQEIIEQCVDLPSVDNAYCELITRGNDISPLVIDTVRNTDINIGRLSARGIDFQGVYDLDLADVSARFPGSLRLVLNGTYLDLLEEVVDTSDPSTLEIEDGEFDDPTWRVNFSASWLNGPLSIDWSARYLSGGKFDVQVPDERYDYQDASSRIYNDVVVGYSFGDRYQLRLGANNVFDVEPPRTWFAFAGAFDAALYDNIGRFYFLDATARF